MAVIPDGNRRFSVKYKMPMLKAYGVGYEKILDFTDFCIENKVKKMIIWSLSAENFKRKSIEKLLKFEEQKIKDIVTDERIHKNEIRVEVLSTEMNKLPKSMKETIKMVYDATNDYTKYCLKLLLGYSAQNEIIQMMAKPLPKKIKDVVNYLLITDKPDLVIRTGLESRTSGFLPLQTAYSEWYHVNCLWPEIQRENFEEAFDWYHQQKRNFGN